MAKIETTRSPEEQEAIIARFGFDKPDDFAETNWPENPEGATADQIIRHSVRQGAIEHEVALLWMRHADKVDRGTPENQLRNHKFVCTLGAFIANAQVAVLLNEIQKRDIALADEMARLVWDMTEDGGVLGELSWEFLHKRGVHADAFYDWARSLATERFAFEEPTLSVSAGEEGK